jgi:tetratricopeptide (TPR) repeat protein
MKRYDETVAQELSPEAVQQQVDRILGSEKFSRSKRLRSLLRFTVNQTLQGNADTLKEYVIGTEVLKKPGSYDPRRDSLVRVLASRLRVKLREYYHNGGSDDPLVIEFPKGKYVPRFQRRELLQTEIEKKLRARNAYSLGKFIASKYTEEALAESTEHFREAIDADPTWALPHIELATVLSLQAVLQYRRPREVWAQVRIEAEMALQLDEMSSEAHLCLGLMYAYFDWRWPDAEHHFEKAVERDSYSGAGHLWRALACLIPANQMEAAEDELIKAGQLAPAPFLDEGYALAKYLEGQYQQVLDLPESTALPEWTGWLRGNALAALGRIDEAIEQLAKLEQTTRVLSSLGYIYGSDGQTEKAQQILTQLRQRREEGKWVPNYQMAVVEAGLGNRSEALAFLQEGMREKETALAYTAVDPCLNSLRTTPKFVEMEARIFAVPTLPSQDGE